MGRYITSALAAASVSSVIAPLIPGVPVFGSGIRQIFTSSGTFVSNGQAVRVYVIGGAGGGGSSVSGGGGGFATAIVTPPIGNIDVIVAAMGASQTAGGTSSFGTSTYLVSAGGGGAGDANTGEHSPGLGLVGTLLITGEMSNGSPTNDHRAKLSGARQLPYGISGSHSTSGAGVVIVEY